jgi:hypothetical protein
MTFSSGFSFVHESPSLFFANQPNVGWNAETDGPINKHLPSLFTSKLEDTSWKYYLVHHAFNDLSEIASNISANAPPNLSELSLNSEYPRMLMLTNYIFLESRATLDLLANALHYLYRRKLPQSFSDLLFKKIGKGSKDDHLSHFNDDKPFKSVLEQCRNDSWINEIVSINRESHVSIRDIVAHEGRIDISARRNNSGAISFLMSATRGADKHVDPNSFRPLMPCTHNVVEHVWQILFAFQQHYSQQRVRELLGLPVDGPGLIEPTAR